MIAGTQRNTTDIFSIKKSSLKHPSGCSKQGYNKDRNTFNWSVEWEKCMKMETCFMLSNSIVLYLSSLESLLPQDFFLVIICLVLWLTGMVNLLHFIPKSKQNQHSQNTPQNLYFWRPEIFSRSSLKYDEVQT